MKKNFTFLFTLLLAVVGVRAEVAADLAGKYFTAAEAATSLQTDTWYLLKNQGRGAYISEESDGLKMKAVGNVPQFAEATANAGVLFKLASGENEGQYSIISGNGNYLTFGSSSSAVSATPVNYIINSITEGYWYMQDPTTNIVADGNAAGGTFVGWGTSVPTSASGNNVYQFLEVSLFDAAKMTVLDKAANMAYDLQVAYGLVTDASKFSSNAPEPNEGSFGALIDGEYTSFFHSAWSYNIEGAHHLQAEVSKPVESFFFFFKKRSQNNNNRPTDVTILGSNDGEAFTEITTISTGFPVDASDLAYTSAVITAQEAYKHFRFVVNATNSSSTFFTFSEFYLLPADKAADLAVAQALVAAGPAAENFDELAAEFETVCNNIQNQKIAKMYADAVANAEAIVAAASHADVPVLGQYPTYTYNVFKAAIDELKGEATQENLDGINAAIAEFEATKNLPMFTINSLKDYAVGQSIYENENGGLNFKATDATDKSMLWAFDMTATEVGLTDKVVVRNVGTGNLFWGASFISVIETEPAVEGDGVFMFKTEGTGAPVHAQQSGSAIVRWSSADANTVGGASTWTFTYVGNTYELLDLPQEPEHDEADYDLTEGTWSDATSYLANADFASIEGWTVAVDHVGESYGGTYYKLDTGTDPNTIEVYHTWGGTSTPLDQTKNFKISQKVMLPAGIYCLKANGFYREGAEQNATTEKAWIFAGESTQNLVGIGTCGANNMGDAANVFKNGGCLNEFTFTVAEDGEVEIGFQGYINTTLSWVILGPVTLEKKVTLKDNFMEQAAAFSAFGQSSMALYSLGAVQEKWAEAMAVVDPLYGALAEGGKALKTEVVAAMELMTTTMAEIKPVVEYYDGKFTDTKWAMYDIQDNSTANSDEVRAAFDDVLAAALNVSAVTTVAELEAKVAEMEAARQAYVLNAVPAEGFVFDYTFKVVNPDFNSNIDGWTCVNTGHNGGAGYNNVGGIAEIALWGAESWEASISQTLNELPNGKYIVKAAWMAASGIEMTFVANEGETTVTGIGDQGGNIDNDGNVVEMGQGFRGWQYVEVEGVVVDGTLTITVNSSSTTLHTWSNADAFELYYAGTVVEEPEQPEVDPNDYTSYIKNADLSVDVEKDVADAGNWNTVGTKGISGGMVKVSSGATFDFSQIIALPAGQYKMTAQAAFRFGGDEQAEYDAIQAGTETHLVKLYAQTATYKYEANVQNRYEGASDTDYAAGSGSVTVNGKFVPNSSSAVQTWFNNGQYVNELVFNVQEDGEIKIGIANVGNNPGGEYTNIGAWTLTRLGDAEADPEVEEPTPDPDPTPEPEETIDMDVTNKVGTGRDAWEGNNGGPVTIDGISMPEKYETTTATLGDVMWQTVTGLENGKYTVELWANARYTSGRGFDSEAADGALDFTYLYANNVEISIEVYHNGGLNSGKSYKLEGVEVTDGTLKMGMTKKAAGSNWHTIQIKSLIYHAPANAALDMAKVDLQAALDAANAVDPKKDDFVAAIAAAQGVYDNSKSVEEIEAATATLLEATKLAILGNASPSNPVLTDFVVNGTFDTNGVVTPWKTTTSAQNQTTATNQQGAFTGNFFENWNPSAVTGKIYQVIENVPNGIYDLSICAFVNNFNGAVQFVYANADKVALTSGEPTAYTVRTIVENNTIEVGFEQTEAVANWMGIDNVSLTYLGEYSNDAEVNMAKANFTAAYEEFNAALAACQAQMLKVNFYEVADAADQLNAQLESTTDIEALNAMVAQLNEATASLNEINAVYAEYDVYVQKFKAAAEWSEPLTTEAAELLEYNMYGGAGMQAMSIDALKQAIEQIKADYVAYAGNAKLYDGNMFDFTYLIQNPDFEANLDGWTGDKANRIGGEGYDGVGGIAEIGEWGATSWNASMSQAITGLPNGKYVVKAAWMSATGIQMTFAANAGETTVTGIGDQGGNIAKDGSVVEMGQGHRGWQYVEVEGLVEDGTLTILVSSSSETQYQWSNADAFELYYAGVPEVVEPEYLAIVSAVVGEVALVEGTATVQSISTIDVTFDRPVALAENAGWATLEDKWGPTNLDAEVLAENACVVRFTVSAEFNGEFTDAGEYELNIPEGFIVGAEGANFINAEIAAVITIEAAPVTPLAVTNVTVGEEVMADYSAFAADLGAMIKVNFDGKFYFQGVPVIVDAEGNDASDAFEFMNGLDYDGTNSYIFMGSKAGIYTITLAKESFMEYEMMGWKAPAEDIVLTVQIIDEGQGIDNITVDADAVIYDLSGRRVYEMTKGIYIVNGKKVIKK